VARIAALPPLPSANGVYAAAEAAKALGMTPLTAAAAPAALMALQAVDKAYEASVTAVGHAYLSAGSLTRQIFYRGWSRVETPAQHGVVISRPDQGVQWTLDLTARAYRETRTADAQEETYVVSAADDVMVTVGGDLRVESLPPMTMAGVLARGYRSELAFALSAPLGFCSRGNHVLSEVEYVADAPDPQSPAREPLGAAALGREACAPAGGASHREPGRLVMYRFISITGGPPYGDTAMVLERGHLRAVQAADAALFEVPPGFKKAP
jgi:hypothetical protein